MEQKNTTTNKSDRNKIYFLAIVIAALLGTNAYLFFKDKRQNERFVTVNSEKERLQVEIEKIEVELDKVNALNLNLSDKLQGEQKLARDKIAELKSALQKGQITQGELSKAQKQISELKEFVKNYTLEIDYLKTENALLKSTRDSLQNSLKDASKKNSDLEHENSNLSTKVKQGSALKAGKIVVKAYRIRSNGKNVEVTRSSTAQKLIVSFDVIQNQLANKGLHTVYLRVFDPAGNLLADENNLFTADGQQLQFSSSINISYTAEGSTYPIEWTNAKPFTKGIYSVILYADGYTMGKSQIELR